MSEPFRQFQKVVRDENFLDIYATQLRISVSFMDFSITLSVQDDLGMGESVVKDKAVLRMSPVAVKQLQIHLAAAVSAYEEVCGKIPAPDATEISTRQLQVLMKAGLTVQMKGPPPPQPS